MCIRDSVVTDPKGTILVECGKMLQRGAPKLGKDGKPMKDKHGKVIYEPYQIRVLNTINFNKSMHYNPFSYIHSEKDILKLVTTLIANTKGEGKAGDDFWVKAETLLYCALIYHFITDDAAITYILLTKTGRPVTATFSQAIA